MKKELISEQQAVGVLATILMGSTILLGGASEIGQDIWIALLISIAGAVPLLVMYARMQTLAPGKNFYELILQVAGGYLGRMAVVLYSWYFLHIGALVLRNFSEFIKITTLTQTPQLVIKLSMILVSLYLAKSGIEVLGRWVLIVCLLIMAIVFITSGFSIPLMEWTNLLPVMEHDISEIMMQSLALLTFPFGDVLLFLALGDALRKRENVYRIYLWGLAIGGFILLLAFFRNLLTLGIGMMETIYFPSYAATRIVRIGTFLERIEGFLAFVYILAGVSKIAVCTIAAAKGLAALFSLPSYQRLLIPTGLLKVALSAVLYVSVMEMFAFMKYNMYYAIPFQLVIPVVIWLIAEWKRPVNSPKAARGCKP